VAEEVPGPWVLGGLEAAILALDVERTHLVEAAELTGRARSSLQPDDQWNLLVLDGGIEGGPEGVVDGCRSLRIIPIDILIAGEGLKVQSGAGLRSEELGRIGERILRGDDE
jgi:hypothetical protein